MYSSFVGIIVIIYLSLSIKVSEWVVISLLGFIDETPENFIKNPFIYKFVLFSFFIALIVIILFQNLVSSVFGLSSLVIVSFVLKYLGKKRALKTYKSILIELFEGSDSKDEKRDIIHDLEKSNRTIMKEARQRRKMGL